MKGNGSKLIKIKTLDILWTVNISPFVVIVQHIAYLQKYGGGKIAWAENVEGFDGEEGW